MRVMSVSKPCAFFIAPFRSGLSQQYREANEAGLSGSMQALRAQSWPYDFGDDPSFYSAHTRNSPVTWGVCRRDVRRIAQPGDVLLFFSVQEEQHGGPFVYKFCALLTIAEKIKQTDIWEKAKYRHLRQYENLLLRPHQAGKGWEHYEPGVPERDWHDDWLSRLTFKDSKTKEFVDAQASGHVSAEQSRRFVAPNYVIFSTAREQSFVCAEPTAVATCAGNGNLETWVDTSFAKRLKSFTVARTRGSLRTRNPQRAHRHSTWREDAGELGAWRNEFLTWLEKVSCRASHNSEPRRQRFGRPVCSRR